MRINCVFDAYIDIEVELDGSQLAALQSTPQTLDTVEGDLTLTHDGLCVLRQYHDRMPFDYHGEWIPLSANANPNRPSDFKLYHGLFFVRDEELRPTTAGKMLTDIGIGIGRYDGSTNAFVNCFATGAMLTAVRELGKKFRFVPYLKGGG